jgi:hypothetical protein
MFFHDRAYLKIYKYTCWGFLFASIGVFLHPGSIPLVTAFAVLGAMIDIVGVNIYPIFIQETVKPNLFPEYFTRFNSADIVGKIFASFLVIGFSKWKHMEFFFYFSWVFLFLHGYLTYMLYKKVELPVRRGKIPFQEVKAQVLSGMQFLRENYLVRTSIYLVIWVQLLKFILDYAFYQGATAHFPIKEDMATFVSTFQLGFNLASLLLMNAITVRIVNNISLSLSMTFLPITVMVLSACGLIAQPFIFVSIAIVAYTCFFRSIHKPVTRQFLIPVPQAMRKNLVVLLTILCTISNVAFSSVIGYYSDFLDVPLSLMIVIALCIGVFFLLSNLDAYYVKNMWNTLKEKREDENTISWSDNILVLDGIPDEAFIDDEKTETKKYFEKIENKNLTPEELQEISTEWEKRKASKNFLSTIDLFYQAARHPQLLRMLVKDHMSEVFQKEPRDKFAYLSIIEDLRPSLAEKIFTDIKERTGFNYYESKEYLTFKKPVEEFMAQAKLQNIDLVTRKRIKTWLEQVLHQGNYYPHFQQIPWIFEQKNRLIQDLVEILADKKFASFHSYVFECFTAEKKFSLKHLLENLNYMHYSESRELRIIIAGLAKHRAYEVHNFIRTNLESLEQNKFNIWQEETFGAEQKNRDLFLHLMYLNEVILKPKAVSKLLRSSIENILKGESEERDIVIEMHKRFLSQGKFFKQWRSMF